MEVRFNGKLRVLPVDGEFVWYEDRQSGNCRSPSKKLHTHSVVHAIEISHTACKYEFQEINYAHS